MNASQTPRSQRGSAALVVLAILLMVGAVAGFVFYARNGSPISSSPNLYQAQLVSSTPMPIAFVQGNASSDKSVGSVTATSNYPAVQTAGDLNVLIVGWHGTSNSVSSVKDTAGNAYALAIGPTRYGKYESQSIYYAKSIKGGANTVTVKFAASVNIPQLVVLEYRGADASNPLNAVQGQGGTGTANASSGPAFNVSAGELLVGAGISDHKFTAPGSGYAERALSSPYSRMIAEDQVVTAAGYYSASAAVNATAATWVMQLAVFNPVLAPTPTPSATPMPTPPAPSSVPAVPPVPSP